ncbi:hypothetical protein D9619_002995 [Psilocybe cf. subviscida]|uniref:Urease accessory protein UreD n=1 Tax=Psilocybe cf. subviscida TaxID=2480587 RepID=A0A8H5B055_9AGAR|nr:hypothetical protein D9619_002995 [Psilocybe cf. subviscida]
MRFLDPKRNHFHTQTTSAKQVSPVLDRSDMAPMAAPTLVLPQEEWPDADFDIPEGTLLHASSDKDDEDEDWDLEMDIEQPQITRPKVVSSPTNPPNSDVGSFSGGLSGLINIRPPLKLPEDADEEEEEGISTIKALTLPTIKAKPAAKKPLVDPIDEDFEDGLALPSDMTQLSLAPLSLSHRASKASLEWGDKDNSSSSQSSDAYSTLGFAEASSVSTSSPAPSLHETETEEDDDDLDGLVLPSAMFESGQSSRQLKKILDMKKKAQPILKSLAVPKVDPEDDFETGLIITDDVDLSPSRLVSAHNHGQRIFTQPKRPPSRSTSSLRIPSRSKPERSKSPIHPPTSSMRQLQKIRLSPSPPLRPPSRSQQGYQAMVSPCPPASPTPSPSSGLLVAKPGSLRGQKSHSGLKPPTPTNPSRTFTRKASLSSLVSPPNQGTQFDAPPEDGRVSRYEVPTAASRAKHKNSTSRIHDLQIPPTRPSTPASNNAALRLTLPTQSRLRSRPALSQVFAGSSTSSSDPSIKRSISPLPPIRQPSTASLRSSAPSRTSIPTPPIPKLLKRPKRARIYGDGTELDALEDLPTDREKEIRYHVQPKGFANRIPGSTYNSKTNAKSLDTRSKGRSETSGTNDNNALQSATNTLRRTSGRIDFPTLGFPSSDVLPKKKKNVSSPSNSTSTKRKPTLIRNLNGSTTPKVVGDMKWNPSTLRWEGNDQVLRDFDAAVGTSTRPALITHLSLSAVGSPVGSLASGARIVGNMIFDPTRMCWVSTLPPDEEEPDVFANLADDEEDGWESKGGTIRANILQISNSDTVKGPSDTIDEMCSPASHSRTISESGSERGSRASMVVCDVDDAFIASCRKAEERHKAEMKGWKSTLSKQGPSDRAYLFDIRDLATRNLLLAASRKPNPKMNAGLEQVSRLLPGQGCISVAIHGDRAIISELSSTYPLKLLSPTIQNRTALVYLLSYGGGLVGGDEVNLSVRVDKGARLVLLSQGTTKVFKTRPGSRLATVKTRTTLPGQHSANTKSPTRQTFDFHIATEGLLLLLPEPVTCFRNASYTQMQKFHIDRDASVVILDWLTSGRIALDEEWVFSRYYSLNEVVYDGKTIIKDSMLLDNDNLDCTFPGRALRDRLQPYSCYAMLFLHGPMLQSVIKELIHKYDEITVFKTRSPSPLIWSLSPLDSADKGLVVRVAGMETEQVKTWVKEILSGLEGTVGLDAYHRVFP